jgi:large subunit ribosomal protein L2
MPIRVYKKTSAGRRNASVNMHAEVTKKSPEKSLLRPKPKSGGRNHSRQDHRPAASAAASSRCTASIDFKRRDRDGIEGKVVGIEYDPNRSCHIALVSTPTARSATSSLPPASRMGMTIVDLRADRPVEPKVGNCMKLRFIPTGLDVHCVELIPGRGAQMCRSAGTYAKLSNKEGDYATLVLPSRRSPSRADRVPRHDRARSATPTTACVAGQGRPDPPDGRRPITRGVAKSHHAHPLGGGSGRSARATARRAARRACWPRAATPATARSTRAS